MVSLWFGVEHMASCQTAIAEKIRKKQAHYVLSAQENQPGIYNDIQEYFDLIESRKVLTEENLNWLSGREQWKDLKSIIVYRRKWVEEDTTIVSTHYYISSLVLDAGETARAIRGHWSIRYLSKMLLICGIINFKLRL
jgi:predicted transposase YbfD/YdcC